MYQPIQESFKKQAPTAEILPKEAPAPESELYFQLLSDYGISLNAPQKEAVAATEGPVLLVAGAGAGKTTVLTSRIGYMIHTKQIDPSSILLVTFTKKASTEMIERLARIPGLDRNASRSVHAGTYHSICLRILRAEGYQFQVLSSERRKHIMLKTIMKRMRVDESYSAETVANVISNWKNRLIRPEDVQTFVNGEERIILKELKEIYSRYENVKNDQNLYDFDDFLIETYYLFLHRPHILAIYQQQFQYILCDEFQDSSYVQYEIIRMLATPQNNLCIVGDDAQLIYSFRASDISFMTDFDKVYPDCRKIVMDINYRSAPSIVGFGNAIIRHNPKQIKKTLIAVNSENIQVQYAAPETSDTEAQGIVEDIKKKFAAGMNLRDIAIIYRTHATGRAIFDKLLLADIPFVTYSNKSESFYSNVFVKPIMSLLKIAVNPRDDQAIIDAAPIFYISRSEMQKVIEQILISHGGYYPDNLFEQAMKRLADMKNDYQKKQLVSKINAVKSLQKMTAPQAIREIRMGAIAYEKQLEVDGRKTLTIHKEMVLEYLDECEQASRDFRTINEFLVFVQRVDEKNREMEELRRNPHIDAVRLMTIHASKGLEFDVVYGIGWCEGILPHESSLNSSKEDSSISAEEALEEERRLAYVCVTRAKQHLYISSPKRHRNKESKISRFVEEAMSEIKVSKTTIAK